MALLCTDFRTVASLSTHPPNRNRLGLSVTSSRNNFVLLLSVPIQCCRFGGRAVPAADFGLLPLRLTPHCSPLPAQLTRGTPTRYDRAAAFKAGELISMAMATPAADCLTEMEPPPARIAGWFMGSLITLTGGLLAIAGSLGRGSIQSGGGAGRLNEADGNEKGSAMTDLLRLGSGALVIPAGVGTPATSSSGVSWPQYFPGMHDILAGVATLAGALTFIHVLNELAKRDVLEKKLSRKLVHIGVGLGFMLFWPLFTSSAVAPYLAAFAPAMNGVRVLLVGLGLMTDDALVKSMTREGDRRELLRGPFSYALAVVITTVGFWRTSPVGIVALVNLCAGDGFADIIGRNFGTRKLPYNEDKSIAGTVAFFITSSILSMIYLSYFAAFGNLKIFPGTFLGVLLVSFFTGLVESLPVSTRLDDNFTVPFAAIVLGMLFLPSS